jgi:type I restriction enzyme S subunit
MQKLLTGRHRLKGFSEPWKEVKLGEIGAISSAGVDKKIVAEERLVELLNYMDVYKKDFLYKDDTSMTVSAPERQIVNCNLKKGDIFFTPSSETRDDIAHSAVIMEDIDNGVYSYHIVRLRPFIQIDLKFSAYAFKTDKFYKQAQAWCAGSGQRYVLSQNDFRNMKIYIPTDISEQKAIADILSAADEEIDVLNKKLEALKKQKQGLMQQLLTGKIRVKVH